MMWGGPAHSVLATFAHKLNHGPLQCGQCAFDKHCLLLEVQQKIIPHRLLGQHLKRKKQI